LNVMSVRTELAKRSRSLALRSFACCVALGCPLILAQSSAQENRKQKEFGSSLRQLKKRTPEEKVAVATARQTEKDDSLIQDGDVIRIEVALAAFDVSVFDSEGRPVLGLTQDEFIVSEEGEPEVITTFAMGNDASRPRSIVLIIDYSSSQLPYIGTSLEAAKTLVEQLRSTDKMAIVTDDVSLLIGFTQDKMQLKNALRSLAERISKGPLGRSTQYSALMATLRELVTGPERQIIIFQTDGDELPLLQPIRTEGSFAPATTTREFSLTDLLTEADKSRATIYTIIPGLQLIGLPPDTQMERCKVMLNDSVVAESARNTSGQLFWKARTKLGFSAEWLQKYVDSNMRQQTALGGLSKMSGGSTQFLEKPVQAAQIYSRILSDIDQRYILGYQPTNKKKDGKRRKVSITVKGHPDYTISGRNSYYAPGG
jgi:VWFA-related protein